MRWDEEEADPVTTVKGFRPVVMDDIVGPAMRFRHPAVQKEVDRRIALYGAQVERTGRIRNWLPRRGSGR